MSSDDLSDPVDFADAAAIEPESGKPPAELLFAPMAEALDQMQQGTLLVDGDGRILYANRQARELLAVGDGLGASVNGLHADTPDEAQTLRRLIASAARAEGASRAAGMMAIKRRCGRRPLAVLVVSCHTRTRLAAAIHPQRAVLVFVTDPDRASVVQSDLLRQLYRLTRMEAEIALAMLRGEGLKAIAESFGVSLSTARTHLQNVFDKTETRRQAELVHLLLRSVPDVSVS
jgi:DNA-binding CsgD family transcriptional regulator